jgi:hypothetical protein
MAMSRRQFLGTAAGGAGLLLGSGLVSPARAAVCADPRPIPGGFAEFGHFYHQRYPNQDTADTEDPSTITDFNGHIGLAYVEGMGTHTDKMTGKVRHLPYRIDLRFMQGVYVGKDGKHHYGAFGAIWLDFFDGSESQIHDFNPGITDFDPDVVDTGLFWTSCIDPHDVDVTPGTGRATMSVRDLAMPDYFNWPNAAVLGALEGTEPGVVSFHIEWAKSKDRRRFSHGAGTPDQWRATVVLNEARAEWEGETARARYVSDLLATSHSLFAEVGHERNGVFFR